MQNGDGRSTKTTSEQLLWAAIDFAYIALFCYYVTVERYPQILDPSVVVLSNHQAMATASQRSTITIHKRTL